MYNVSSLLAFDGGDAGMFLKTSAIPQEDAEKGLFTSHLSESREIVG